MTTPRFFDAHTHVHFAAFKDDAKEVIDRALAAETWLTTVGTQKDTSAAAVKTANEYTEGVYAAIGLHPIHTAKSWHDASELGDSEDAKGFTSRGEEFDYAFYKQLAENPKTVAIGECGLDFFRIDPATDLGQDRAEHIRRQKEAFEAQIALAAEVEKPLMVHCRDAFPELIDILSSTSQVLRPSIVHFFTGTAEDARKLLDLGFSFTFGGVVTFTRNYDEAIKIIPLDRILSETDAPYVAPTPYRGKRNEPMYVAETVKKLAEIKGVTPEEMAAATVANARRVFGI